MFVTVHASMERAIIEPGSQAGDDRSAVTLFQPERGAFGR